MKKLQNSDFRMGLIDDDGQNMPEIINQTSARIGEIDSPKSSFPTEAFLRPIILDRKIREKICHELGVQDENVSMYLWNKLSDPHIHPNDYVKLEEPSELVFSHVLTTCRGIIPLEDIFQEKIILDNKLMDEVLTECHERAIEENEYLEEEVLEGFDLIEDELEIQDSLDIETIAVQKIKDMFSQVKQTCCKHLNDGSCFKRHYLIGQGSVVVEEKKYQGIHVYLYPDVHYEQTDSDDEIVDQRYLRYKKNPTKQKRDSFVRGYAKDLRKTL